MTTNTFSKLSFAVAIALASLLTTSTSFAAKQHAAKHATSKKAESSKKAEPSANAVPPLAAQDSLAPNAPAIAAKAWLLMDFDSGELLASANVDEPLPPASLTKMMTSYIVEQALRTGKLKPTDLVSVSQNAWCRGTNTESCMYLPLNSQATVIDILRGIIVQSGNDASKAIAEHMAGSEEGFAKLMNAEAQKLGMKNTTFVNPTGCHFVARHHSQQRRLLRHLCGTRIQVQRHQAGQSQCIAVHRSNGRWFEDWTHARGWLLLGHFVSSKWHALDHGCVECRKCKVTC
jgi:D-alanyl-D-alanine carboxypeptidase (penicillin-binding protein 5/6)